MKCVARLLLLFCAIALLHYAASEVSAQAGSAQTDGIRPRCVDRFNSLDKNGDGVVTMDEFSAPKPVGDPSKVFKSLDANGDGVVSQSEFESKSHGRPNAAQAFKARDVDGDGVISEDEFATARQRRSPDDVFQKRDVNGDGQLTQDEFCGGPRGGRRGGAGRGPQTGQQQ